MSTELFIANPHSLFTKGVCTAVVYMQDYNEEEIAETLKGYEYEEVVRWDDYGHPIYIGYHKVGENYVPHKMHKSWTLDTEVNDWSPPKPHTGFYDGTDEPYVWDESLLEWTPCVLCKPGS